jgi:hypothetical protein
MSHLKPVKALKDSGSVVFPGEARAYLKRMVGKVGSLRMACAIRVSVNTLTRVIAGMPVRRGTAALVQTWLDKPRVEASSPPSAA